MGQARRSVGKYGTPPTSKDGDKVNMNVVGRTAAQEAQHIGQVGGVQGLSSWPGKKTTRDRSGSDTRKFKKKARVQRRLLFLKIGKQFKRAL